MGKLIYLDNNASTPCDPRVVEAMLPYFAERCGNPSAVAHAAGRAAADAVDAARKEVAGLVGAVPKEIVFTSGATESNNLGIFGVANARVGWRSCVVTTSVEHRSVLEPCKVLGKQGLEVHVLPVHESGIVSVDAARRVIDENTLLVSVQLANNETGTIQAVSETAERAHQVGVIVHCDAAQAVGKIPVDVDALGVDLLSLSAHKIYGPKGVGALYVRRRPRATALSPLAFGGGQECGIRPGTLNVAGIVGFGEACRLCRLAPQEESDRIAALRDRIESSLKACFSDVTVNGARNSRLSNTSSLTFHDIDAEALIVNLRDVAVSNGSACNSGAPEPSHVLTAMGIGRDEAHSTIRS